MKTLLSVLALCALLGIHGTHAACVTANGVLETGELCDTGLTGCTACKPDDGYFCDNTLGTPTCTNDPNLSAGDATIMSAAWTAAGIALTCTAGTGNCVLGTTAAYCIKTASGVTCTKCGDSRVTGHENCDPGANTVTGCATCAFDAGAVYCDGSSSSATTFCSKCVNGFPNGVLDAGETCDSVRGCTALCSAATGYTCTGGVCTATCNDGFVNGAEQCDKAGDDATNCVACQIVKPTLNTGTDKACDGSSNAPTVNCWICGDGVVDAGEACDDGNIYPSDGCNERCQVEAGYTCTTTSPSKCSVHCLVGGGIYYHPTAGPIALGPELGRCADGNVKPGDGCDENCATEPGFIGTVNTAFDPTTNTFTTATYAARCGDGILAKTEECDDGNILNKDGCSFDCKVEVGYLCRTADFGYRQGVSICSTECNGSTGQTDPNANCADSNNAAWNLAGGDFCAWHAPSASCRVHPSAKCAAVASTGKFTCVNPAAAAVCGDGVVSGAEVCDAVTNDGSKGCAAGCAATTTGALCRADSGTLSNPGTSCKLQTECGNGIVDGTEICDDGNTSDGDGCSAACDAIEPYFDYHSTNGKTTFINCDVVQKLFAKDMPADFKCWPRCTHTFDSDFPDAVGDEVPLNVNECVAEQTTTFAAFNTRVVPGIIYCNTDESDLAAAGISGDPETDGDLGFTTLKPSYCTSGLNGNSCGEGSDCVTGKCIIDGAGGKCADNSVAADITLLISLVVQPGTMTDAELALEFTTKFGTDDPNVSNDFVDGPIFFIDGDVRNRCEPIAASTDKKCEFLFTVDDSLQLAGDTSADQRRVRHGLATAIGAGTPKGAAIQAVTSAVPPKVTVTPGAVQADQVKTVPRSLKSSTFFSGSTTSSTTAQTSTPTPQSATVPVPAATGTQGTANNPLILPPLQVTITGGAIIATATDAQGNTVTVNLVGAQLDPATPPQVVQALQANINAVTNCLASASCKTTVTTIVEQATASVTLDTVRASAAAAITVTPNGVQFAVLSLSFTVNNNAVVGTNGAQATVFDGSKGAVVTITASVLKFVGNVVVININFTIGRRALQTAPSTASDQVSIGPGTNKIQIFDKTTRALLDTVTVTRATIPTSATVSNITSTGSSSSSGSSDGAAIGGGIGGALGGLLLIGGLVALFVRSKNNEKAGAPPALRSSNFTPYDEEQGESYDTEFDDESDGATYI